MTHDLLSDLLSDDSKPVAVGKGKKFYNKLKKDIADKEKRIKKLELELARYKIAGAKLNNTQVWEELRWTGEETNFAETVNNFCKNFLFKRVQFLKDKWQSYLPERYNIVYSGCMRHLKIPEGSDERDIWERVIVPSVARKYQNMKCNLNNDIKLIHMSMKLDVLFA